MIRVLIALVVVALVAGDTPAGPFRNRRAANSASACSTGGGTATASACGTSTMAACAPASALTLGACAPATTTATIVPGPVDPPATVTYNGYTYQLVPTPKK